MKNILVILLLYTTATFGQAKGQGDSATINLKNEGKFILYDYQAVVAGEHIYGRQLKPGQSVNFKIAVTGEKLYRFTVYTDKKHTERYSIEPMDYFEQVSDVLIEKGTYTYSITIDKDRGILDVKLDKESK